MGEVERPVTQELLGSEVRPRPSVGKPTSTDTHTPGLGETRPPVGLPSVGSTFIHL